MHTTKDALKVEVNQTLKDVHKTIQAIVEEDLTKEQFEEAFLLQRITLVLSESSIIAYSKLPKLLRLITILMIQSNSEACNKDHILCTLLQLLKTVTTFFVMIKPTPFDQMASCLDTVLLKPQTKTIGLLFDSSHLLAEPLL